MSIIENTTAPNVVKDEYFREATPSETGYKSESVSIPVPFVSENQTFDLSARYESRQTANGRHVVDNFPTFVKKIHGDTVRSINLIPFPYTQQSGTQNGVTYTINSDGSITCNGTPTATVVINLFSQGYNKTIFENGQKYTMFLGASASFNISTIYINSNMSVNGTSWGSNFGNTLSQNPLSFTIPTHTGVQFYLVITTNAGALNKITFYPMIVEGSYTASTMPAYQPYFKDLKNAYINNIVSAGRNLIPISSTASTTREGIKITNNGDGSFTLNGTCTAPFAYQFWKLPSGSTETDTLLHNGAYSVTLGANLNGAAFTLFGTDANNVDIVYARHIPKSFGVATVNIRITSVGFYFFTGATYDNVTVYPMLVKGSYTASTMPPYQKYITDTYQLNSSVELGKYDYIDVVRKKLVRQTKTIVITGDEFWGASSTYIQGKRRFALYLQESKLPKVLSNSSLICNDYPTVTNDNTYFNVVGVSTTNNSNYIYVYDEAFAPLFADGAKAHLKSLYDAGTPVIISYCAEDILSEEDIEVPETYLVWDKGSETIHQGEIDNSVYGALIEVDQTYVESYTMPLVVTQKSYTSYTIEHGQITIHYPNESKTYFAQKVVGSNDD